MTKWTLKPAVTMLSPGSLPQPSSRSLYTLINPERTKITDHRSKPLSPEQPLLHSPETPGESPEARCKPARELEIKCGPKHLCQVWGQLPPSCMASGRPLPILKVTSQTDSVRAAGLTQEADVSFLEASSRGWTVVQTLAHSTR